jgi:hypothetical protein
VPLKTLGQKARDAFEVPRDLLLGRYPPFVTGGPLPRGHVPVFVFHSLEPDPSAGSSSTWPTTTTSHSPRPSTSSC